MLFRSNLAAGTDSREALPELPGVDINKMRQANVCGLGHNVNQCVTREGKRLWLTGHSGASASYLQAAMKLLLNGSATYTRVISHIVPYRAAPRVFESLLTGEPQNEPGVPYVKVILDFTREDQVIEVFEPHYK